MIRHQRRRCLELDQHHAIDHDVSHELAHHRVPVVDLERDVAACLEPAFMQGDQQSAMVDGLEEAVSERIVDVVAGADDLTCKVLVLHSPLPEAT